MIYTEIGQVKEPNCLPRTSLPLPLLRQMESKPVMTGKADLTEARSATQALLTRAIARVDLNIADDADIQINRISMDNIHCEAFLLP